MPVHVGQGFDVAGAVARHRHRAVAADLLLVVGFRGDLSGLDADVEVAAVGVEDRRGLAGGHEPVRGQFLVLGQGIDVGAGDAGEVVPAPSTGFRAGPAPTVGERCGDRVAWSVRIPWPVSCLLGAAV